MASKTELSDGGDTLPEFPKFDIDDFNVRFPQEARPAAFELISHYGYNAAPIEPAPEAEIEPRPDDEQSPQTGAHDNGLGIEIIDSPTETPRLQLVAREPETAKNRLSLPRFSAGKLSFGGIKRIVSRARELPSSMGQAISANIFTSLMTAGEKITLAEHKTARKRLVVAALGGLAVAAAAYATSKGLNLSHTSRAHEALQPAIPTKAPHHVAEALQSHPLKASDAISPVIHHSQKAAKLKPAADNLSQTFTIESGHGFTQEISESFSPKASRLSPLRSYHLFSAMRQHFGDHGMLKHGKGLVDGTYNRDGQEFISRPGRAQWAPGVAKFARQWLNTHAS